MNPTSKPTSNRAGSGFFKGLAAALAAFLALALAATVVSAQASEDGEGADESAVDEEAFNAYRDCLAENGIERPADGERPDRDSITDEQREAFQAAKEACADVLPDGGRFGNGHGRNHRPDFNADELQAFRDCLAENGVEVPAEGERPDRDSVTDEQREAFQTAREACSDELPEGAGPRNGGGFGGRGGPGGTDEEPASFGGAPADELTLS